jgi:hypothetical protein
LEARVFVSFACSVNEVPARWETEMRGWAREMRGMGETTYPGQQTERATGGAMAEKEHRDCGSEVGGWV